MIFSQQMNLEIKADLPLVKINSTLHCLREIVKRAATEKRSSFLERYSYSISSKMWQCGLYNDGKKIPFGDASFDVVLAYAVIEHIPRDEIENIIVSLF